jgi:hypothetical protein
MAMLARLNFFLSFFLFVSPIIAQAKMTKGIGRYNERRGDSSTFVRKELFFLATKDVLSSELRSMNLSPQVFWSSFEEAFQRQYGEKIESWQQTASKMGQERGKLYLRHKMATAKRSFKNLPNLLRTYSPGVVGRSPQNPDARFMSLSAQVDRRKLSNLYYSLNTGKPSSQGLGPLFLCIDFDIPPESWEGLGVSSAVEFRETLAARWKLWLQQGLSGQDPSIVIVEHKDFDKTVLTHSSPEQLQQNLLWIDLKITITPRSSFKVLKSRKYLLSGGILVRRLLSSEISFHTELKDKTIETFLSSSSNQVSQLATEVYQYPISEFNELAQSIKVQSGPSTRVRLHVHNARDLSELDEIKAILSQHSLNLGARVELESFSPTQSVFLIEHFGQESDLLRAVTMLRNKKMKGGKILTFPYEDNPYSLLLSKSVAP